MFKKINLLIFLLLAILMAVFPLLIFAETSCDCGYKNDIKMLLKEAEEALKAINEVEYQPGFANKEYTSDNYDNILKPAIDQAIKNARKHKDFYFLDKILVDSELDSESCQNVSILQPSKALPDFLIT